MKAGKCVGAKKKKGTGGVEGGRIKSTNDVSQREGGKGGGGRDYGKSRILQE